MHPIETGNIVLILVGIGLVLSGPWIIFNVVRGVLKARRADPNADIQIFNNALNLVIAVVFFLAGILFITNNLKGNPLHLKSQTETKSVIA